MIMTILVLPMYLASLSGWAVWVGFHAVTAPWRFFR